VRGGKKFVKRLLLLLKGKQKLKQVQKYRSLIFTPALMNTITF